MKQRALIAAGAIGALAAAIPWNEGVPGHARKYPGDEEPAAPPPPKSGMTRQQRRLAERQARKAERKGRKR